MQTSYVSAVQAAKAWARKHSWRRYPGGWIHDPHGRPRVQGWEAFVNLLRCQGFVVGAGSMWMLAKPYKDRTGVKPLYPAGVKNPQVTRGDFVRPYTGGPVGRYVGTSRTGVTWIVYEGDPGAEERFREQCATFDRQHREVVA